MIGCSTFVETLKNKYNLPTTSAFQMFIEQYDEKFASIDPDFYRVPVMLQSGWRDAHQPMRHVLDAMIIILNYA